MPSNIEAQGQVILDYIITPEQKKQAERDAADIKLAMWRVARLLVELLDHEDIKDELPRGSVVYAVAILYGLSNNTVTRLEKVARMFPPGLVEEHPLLSWSHWKTAADARHLKSPFESALDIVWRIDSVMEAEGKCPVSLVESWVYRDENEKARTVWRSRWDRVESMMEYIYNDGYAPKERRILIGYCRGLLLSYDKTGISPLAMGVDSGGQPGKLPQLSTTMKEQKGGHQG